MAAARALDVHEADMATQEPSEFPAVLGFGAGAVLAEDFAALDDEATSLGPGVDVIFVVARHCCCCCLAW